MGSAFMANNVPDQSCMLGKDGWTGVRNKSSAARLCKQLGEQGRVIEDGLKCIR